MTLRVLCACLAGVGCLRRYRRNTPRRSSTFDPRCYAAVHPGRRFSGEPGDGRQNWLCRRSRHSVSKGVRQELRAKYLPVVQEGLDDLDRAVAIDAEYDDKADLEDRGKLSGRQSDGGCMVPKGNRCPEGQGLAQAVSQAGTLRERLAAITYTGAISDILDEMGLREQVLPHEIRPIRPGP